MSRVKANPIPDMNHCILSSAIGPGMEVGVQYLFVRWMDGWMDGWTYTVLPRCCRDQTVSEDPAMFWNFSGTVGRQLREREG